MKTFELIPLGRQKSFNNKALVIVEGEWYVLQSYNTIVCAFNTKTREFVRTWDGWSATTSRHVDSFLHLFCKPGLCKRDWLNIPCGKLQIDVRRIYHDYEESNNWYNDYLSKWKHVKCTNVQSDFFVV